MVASRGIHQKRDYWRRGATGSIFWRAKESTPEKSYYTVNR